MLVVLGLLLLISFTSSYQVDSSMIEGKCPSVSRYVRTSVRPQKKFFF